MIRAILLQIYKPQDYWYDQLPPLLHDALQEMHGSISHPCGPGAIYLSFAQPDAQIAEMQAACTALAASIYTPARRTAFIAERGGFLLLHAREKSETFTSLKPRPKTNFCVSSFV